MSLGKQIENKSEKWEINNVIDNLMDVLHGSFYLLNPCMYIKSTETQAVC